MIQLIVNGITYLFPEQNDSPAWGEDVTAWASAVTGVLSSVVGVGDILPSSVSISNNISSPANVTGLSFSTSTIRGAIVEYSVYRVTTSTGAMEATEVGTMYLGYQNTANSWTIAVVGTGGAGVTFSITSTGQVQYVSTNFTGSTYSGIMKFRARALLQ